MILYCPVIDGNCEWADVEEEPYEGGWCANPRNDDNSGFPNMCPDPDEEEQSEED